MNEHSLNHQWGITVTNHESLAASAQCAILPAHFGTAKEQLERQLQEHREREAGDKPLDFMGFYTF
jgi:ribosome-associated translation inhibitor RaiA